MKTTHQTPHPMNQYDGMINTPSGKVSLTHPDKSQIDIIDIACGLSNNCHFGGLVDPATFFSIASHSLLVTQLAAEKSDEPNFLLACLIHDAAEGYLGDMKKPMKILEGMETYRKMEHEFTRVIFDAFRLPIGLLPMVKEFDMKAQQIEYETFYKGADLIGKFLSPEESYNRFLQTFYFLIYQIDHRNSTTFREPLIPLNIPSREIKREDIVSTTSKQGNDHVIRKDGGVMIDGIFELLQNIHERLILREGEHKDGRVIAMQDEFIKMLIESRDLFDRAKSEINSVSKEIQS